MNKKTTSIKRTYYRKSQVRPTSSQNLQQLISAALTSCPKVKDRLEAVDAGATSFRLIAAATEVQGVLCGTVVTFERGSYQLVVEDDPEATSLLMAAVEPPKNEGKQQQFVPGALFFAVFEDHVAVVQSAALRANAFEQHLAWLLRNQTKLLTSNQGIVLADEPRRATVERIRQTHVKSLSIGRPFMEEEESTSTQAVERDGTSLALREPPVEYAVAPAAKLTSNTVKDVSKLRPVPAVLNFIKSFLPEDKLSNLNLEDAVFDGNLEVWLEIKYPSRARALPEDTVKLIDNLAIAMRDQDEESVQLQLADGTKVKGSDLKISSSITMTLNSGVPELTNFYEELSSWLIKLIKNGVVSN